LRTRIEIENRERGSESELSIKYTSKIGIEDILRLRIRIETGDRIEIKIESEIEFKKGFTLNVTEISERD
jgi:hypothetical protein